jgi:hypothetical protein
MNVWKMSTLGLTLAMGILISSGAIRSADADAKPDLDAALHSLQQAKLELGAVNKKPGLDDEVSHRAKAVGLTQQAIGEVKKAIANQP